MTPRTKIGCVWATAWLALGTPGLQHRPTGVSLQVLVSAGDGAPRAGLTSGDFSVRAGGSPVAIAGFSAAPGPVTTCLMLDVSESMASRADGRASGANVAQTLDALAASEDTGHRWVIGRVAGTSRLSPGVVATRQVPEVWQALAASGRRGTLAASPIWDGVDACLTRLRGVDGRRGVVLVTDGRASGNRLGLREVIRRALASGIPVSVASLAAHDQFTLRERSLLLVRPDEGLALIARETGGRVVPLDRASGGAQDVDLASAIGAIVADFEQSYLLRFDAEAGAGDALFRLEVTVSAPDVVPRTRSQIAMGGGH